MDPLSSSLMYPWRIIHQTFSPADHNKPPTEMKRLLVRQKDGDPPAQKSLFTLSKVKGILSEKGTIITAAVLQDEKLILGNSVGQLKQFVLRLCQTDNTRVVEASCSVERKASSSGKIDKLKVAPRNGVVLALQGGTLTAYQLDNLQSVFPPFPDKHKNIDSFCFFEPLPRDFSVTNLDKLVLFSVCICEKKTIFIYDFTGAGYVAKKMLYVPEKVLEMQFDGTGDCVALAFSSNYSLICVETGAVRKLASQYSSQSNPPPLLFLPTLEFMFVDENKIVFQEDSGSHTENPIACESPPLKIGFFFPYTICLTENGLRIYNTFNPKANQLEDLEGITDMCCPNYTNIGTTSESKESMLKACLLLDHLSVFALLPNFLVENDVMKKEEINEKDKAEIESTIENFMFNCEIGILMAGFAGRFVSSLRSNLDFDMDTVACDLNLFIKWSQKITLSFFDTSPAAAETVLNFISRIFFSKVYAPLIKFVQQKKTKKDERLAYKIKKLRDAHVSLNDFDVGRKFWLTLESPSQYSSSTILPSVYSNIFRGHLFKSDGSKYVPMSSSPILMMIDEESFSVNFREGGKDSFSTSFNSIFFNQFTCQIIWEDENSQLYKWQFLGDDSRVKWMAEYSKLLKPQANWLSKKKSAQALLSEKEIGSRDKKQVEESSKANSSDSIPEGEKKENDERGKTVDAPTNENPSQVNLAKPPTDSLVYYHPAIEEIKKLNNDPTPIDKLNRIRESLCQINTAAQNFHLAFSRKSVILGGDDIVPIFAWVITMSGVPNLHSESQFLESFSDEATLMSELGYSFATFQTAIWAIEWLFQKKFPQEAQEERKTSELHAQKMKSKEQKFREKVGFIRNFLHF